MSGILINASHVFLNLFVLSIHYLFSPSFLASNFCLHGSVSVLSSQITIFYPSAKSHSQNFVGPTKCQPLTHIMVYCWSPNSPSQTDSIVKNFGHHGVYRIPGTESQPILIRLILLSHVPSFYRIIHFIIYRQSLPSQNFCSNSCWKPRKMHQIFIGELLMFYAL